MKINARNIRLAWKIDDRKLLFNQAIWESVKGANSPMPAPRHVLGGGTASSPPAGSDNRSS